MNKLIETTILEVAEKRGTMLTFHLPEDSYVSGKIIYCKGDMVIIESPINGTHFYYKVEEFRGYSSNDAGFNEEVMRKISVSDASGDDASAYLPKNLPVIPPCPPGFHEPVGD